MNLLGIRPKAVTLCRSELIKGKFYSIIMEPITKKEEQQIDNSIKYYEEIRYNRANNEIITAKNIYLYGEVDFNCDEDLDNIDRFNLIDKDVYACNWIPSNFDFDKGCFTTIENVAKGCGTYDAIKWFKYNYVLLGKPKRIIVYRKLTTYKKK